MRTCWFMLACALGIVIPAQPQTFHAQTARQALIEMLVNSEPEGFAKHLPEAARKLLPETGGAPYSFPLSLISTFGGRRLLRGGYVETLDEGPTLLRNEQSETEKLEVNVEHDILARESDEIELSVHSYREGQEQSLSFIPRFIFTLRQENNIWRLTDVVASARVPLADPDYLRGLRRQQQEANASAAQMRITTIATAQAGYADLHPDRGYTCSLAALFAPEPTETPADDNEQPVIFYHPAQANTEWSGYRFALTGCEGSPSSKYEITAIPIDSDADTKTFCADEARTVKSVKGGKPSDCFNSGDVLSSPNDAVSEPIQ